jgi:hypothetical protein
VGIEGDRDDGQPSGLKLSVQGLPHGQVEAAASP